VNLKTAHDVEISKEFLALSGLQNNVKAQ